jgi:acylglycerol lipase
MLPRLCIAVLVASAAACSSGSKPCLGALPRGETTGEVTRTAYRVELGTQCLQAYEWKGPTPRAALVLVHGLRDHGARYDALAKALVAKGVAVYAYDLRGHGQSGGDRQRFDAFSELTNDVALAVAEAKKRNPTAPVVLFGHSLGGLIAASYAVDHQAELSGLVLSAPALQLQPSVTEGDKKAARFFSRVLPGLAAQALDDTQFVRDEASKKALADDSLVWHSNLPARSASVALGAIETIGSRFKDFALPLMAMHGTKDTATNIEGSKALVAQAASKDKEFVAWPGLYHDLLHEPEREQVIARIVTWVSAHIAPTQ